MSQKYDDAIVIAQMKELITSVNSRQEMADVLGIPRTTIFDILKRNGYSGLDDLLREVSEESLTDLEVLQRQVQHYKKHTKRLETALADREWLRKEVASQMAVMEPVEVPHPAPIGKSPSEQVAVLEISDFHYGLHVPEGQLGPIFGTYDIDIARERMVYTFSEGIRQIKKQSFPVNKLVVYLLGDLIEHSYMRPAQAKHTSIHVVKQTIDMSGILAACLSMACSQFPEVEVHAVPGNHGRVTQKAGENMPDETFEHLIFYNVETALQNQSNLAFHNHPAWYFIDEILGWHFLGIHGEDCFSWAGIPWYGIKRLVQDYYMMIGQASKAKLRALPLGETMTIGDFLAEMQMPDYVCIGHNHDPLAWVLMGVEILANGAGSGASLYSAKKLHSNIPPSQRLFFVHEEHGVGIRIPIDLSGVA